jgi:hypothetical protein
MSQKQKNGTPAPAKKAAGKAPNEAPKKSSSKALWWILGGCLVLTVLICVAVAGIAWWSFKKVKKEIKENKRKFEQALSEAEKSAPGAGMGAGATLPSQSSIPEEPAVTGDTTDNGVPSDIYPPAVSEKAIGYLKKVYTKKGKNFVDIDYVQWLTGAAAEQAMREDGLCPKKGECIVLNDYYIRNQNPLIRTFEVSPDAELLAHDFTADYSTGDWNESWTFARFSNYFNTNVKNGYWDSVPFHVEIGNNRILKITEQYIP